MSGGSLAITLVQASSPLERLPGGSGCALNVKLKIMSQENISNMQSKSNLVN